MQRFEVFANNVLIGHSDLKTGDPPMSVAEGEFSPTPEYATVRSAVIAARESSQAHLSLSVRSIDGRELQASGGIHLLDHSDELGSEGLWLQVCGIVYPPYGDLFPEHVAEYNTDDLGTNES